MAEATPRQLKDYESADGRAPFREWFDYLAEKDPATATRIANYLCRIKLGNLANAKILPGCEGVWELVMNFGPGYRAYFAQVGHTIILLLLGGSKRGQRKDIQMAVRYWRDFKEKNKEDRDASR